jgi:hypothetical protein
MKARPTADERGILTHIANRQRSNRNVLAADYPA